LDEKTKKLMVLKQQCGKKPSEPLFGLTILIILIIILL